MSLPPLRPAPLALAAALALAALPVTAQTPHDPLPSTPLSFQIAAQPLGQALGDWALQAGVQLIVDPTLVASRTAPLVSGRYAPREALERLLAGSGLAARPEGAAVLIHRAPAPPRPATEGRTLAPTTVTARADDGDATEGSGTYTPRAIGIGKAPQALKDTPQSISVVSRQQIEEQGLIDVTQALQAAPGVTLERWFGDAVTIKSRGFSVENFRYDGGPATEQGTRSYTYLSDLISLDRVEVLRGADALAVGAGAPGGSVNLVRKQPTREPQLKFAATLGRWDYARAEGDVGGPLNASGSVRGRLAAALESRDYFYRGATLDKQVVYGAIQADLTPTTLLTAGATYEWVDAKPWQGGGIPRYTDGGLLDVPRSTSYVYDWNRRETNTRETYARLERSLGGDWKATLAANYRNEKSSFRVGVPGFGGEIVDRETGIAPEALNIWDSNLSAAQYGVDVYATGPFRLLGRRHELLVGLDWTKYRLYYEGRNGFGLGDVNFLDFDPGSYPYPSMERLPTQAWSPSIIESRKLSSYLAGRFELATALHLTLGGRLDNIAGSKKTDRRKFIPYGGLTFALDAQHTLYGSVSEVYQSQDDYQGPGGEKLGPMTGRNHEIGAKGAWWEGRLNGFLSLYYLERSGEAVQVPGTEYPCCYLSRGKVVSKGTDLELSGELTPGWNLTAGYTYNRNENRESALPFDTLTPKHLVKLWTAARLPGAAADWKIGGGLAAQSAFTSQGWSLPGFSTASLYAEYRLTPQLQLSLNVSNLFDKTYYQTGGWYGEPRSFLLSVRGSY